MLASKFELELERDPASAVRDLAREEARLARELLISQPAGAEKAVHEFRKSMKGLRALARLVRASLGCEFGACNRALRDAGALLSDFRDDEAILEALHALHADVLAETEQAALAHLEEQVLTHQQQRAADRELPRRVDRALEALSRGARPFDLVHLESYEELRGGFRLTYRSARRRYHEIDGAHDDLALHELRKRVKDHGFHLSLLGKNAPEAVATERAMAGEISQGLGNDHDLVILSERLRSLSFDAETHLTIERVIDVARARHQDQALGLCARLLSEKPRRRTARLMDSLLRHARDAERLRTRALGGA